MDEPVIKNIQTSRLFFPASGVWRDRRAGSSPYAGVMRALCWCALLLTLSVMVGCQLGAKGEVSSLTTNTRSAELGDEVSRRGFLTRYIKLPADLEVQAFHVIYHDQSGGLVPGPSDYVISMALRGDEATLRARVEGARARQCEGFEELLVESVRELQGAEALSNTKCYERQGARYKVSWGSGVLLEERFAR